MAPIVGPRYKCSVCKNFDFCAKCEEFSEHEHAFLKITDPEVVPEVMISSIHEPEHPVPEPEVVIEEARPQKGGFKKVAKNWVDFAKAFISTHKQAEEAYVKIAEHPFTNNAKELASLGIGTFDQCLSALKIAHGNMDVACNMILNENAV